MKLSMNKNGLCMEPFIFFRLEFPELQLDMHPAGTSSFHDFISYSIPCNHFRLRGGIRKKKRLRNNTQHYMQNCTAKVSSLM